MHLIKMVWTERVDSLYDGRNPRLGLVFTLDSVLRLGSIEGTESGRREALKGRSQAWENLKIKGRRRRRIISSEAGEARSKT